MIIPNFVLATSAFQTFTQHPNVPLYLSTIKLQKTPKNIYTFEETILFLDRVEKDPTNMNPFVTSPVIGMIDKCFYSVTLL
jgi:hypothetical protein